MTVDASPSPATAPPHDPGRALRLLRELRRCLSHDHANEFLAVLGLLELLAVEESERLSDEGREYLRRVTAVAQRTRDLTVALAELASLGAAAEEAVTICLNDLLGELAAEMSVRHPGCSLESHLAHDGADVLAPRRLLYQSLARLLCWLLKGKAGPVRLAVRSRRAATGVELSLTDAPAASPPESDATLQQPLSDEAPAGRGRPVDWLLAQEQLAVCGVTLRHRPLVGGHWIELTLPPPAR